MKPLNQLNIILASASPRRLSILQEHGLNAIAMPANIEEIHCAGEDVQTYVTRLAKEKAQKIVSQNCPGSPDVIIAADTVVALHNHILEKPKDRQDAFRMLSMLSGVSHEVYTGYALVYLPDLRVHVDYALTKITFHSLTDEQINDYIKTGDPFDKSGSYGIQNVFGSFVKEIKGSRFNVMGLPIEDILKKLTQHYSYLN
ncbi:Maf family protein [Legionella worsleiensis]|uniref:dTTP/UTP pyrophosphatase n=1 Tax=Legionella worsleiensis TaxID=45076 RepID=A0A0W1A3S2_9GAMM|nr:Maf family protein [Legionella worsleiensis]KTD76013.1 septum formation protein [Legionella worsleiensis]STY33027.1 septum formation protein [Legionella worsleiensis]